jgi:hypothetical protein
MRPPLTKSACRVHSRVSLVAKSLALLAVTMSAACESWTDQVPDSPELAIDTLTSGTVMVSNNPADPDQPPSGWKVREIVRLGGFGADEGQVFGQVAAVGVDPGGIVYVLDRQGAAVQAFDLKGSLIRAIGGRGEGPGEFRDPAGLVIDSEGSVWIRDAGNNRYSSFRRDGAPAGTFRRTLGATVRPLIAGEGGRLWEQSSFVAPASSPRPASAARIVLLGLAPGPDGTMEAPDTIWAPPPLEVATWEIRPVEVRPGMVYEGIEPVPFAPETRGCGDPRGFLWVGTTDRMRFVRISPAGDTVVVVDHLGRAPTPVTPADVDRAIERMVGRFGNDARAAMREALQIERDRIPDEMPRWEACYVDPEGRLWVQRFHDADREPMDAVPWEVYDPDGVYLGVVRLPFVGSPAPAQAGDWLVGVTQDRFEVPQVVVVEVQVDGQMPR